MKKPKYITDQKKFSKDFENLKFLKKEAQERVNALKSVENLPDEAQGIIDELQGKLNSTDAIIQKLNTYDQDFKNLKSQLDDPNTGLEATHKKSVRFKNKIRKYYKAIIEKDEELNSVSERVNELKSDAEETLKVITSGGLANSFGKRAGQIFISKRWWAGGMWFSALSLVGVLAFFYFGLNGKISLDALMIFRLGIISPLVFVIAFSAKQYSKERDLLEKYEFKSVLAQSLQSYTKLLRDEFGDDKEKSDKEILNFILSSIKTVYKEPYEHREKGKKSFRLETPIAKAKTKINDSG